jgi:PII-like signaling protein
MKPGQASLLRLYLNADDRYHHKPLYEVVVTRARELGMAGASVFAADMGYGHHHRIHDTMSEYSFAGAPLVVEVVDTAERIEVLRAELEVLIGEGLVTLSTVSRVEVARYVQPSD